MSTAFLEATIAAAIRDLEDGIKHHNEAPLTGHLHHQADGYAKGAMRVAILKLQRAIEISERERAIEDAAE